MFFEVDASVNIIEGDNIDVISGAPKEYPDAKISLCGVEIDDELTPLAVGDAVKLHLVNPGKKVFKITPSWSLVTEQGTITFCNDDYAIIAGDEKHLCYIQMFGNVKLKLNDRVKVTSVRGDYVHENDPIELRVVELSVIPERARRPPKPKRKEFNKFLQSPLKNYYNLPIVLQDIFDSGIDVKNKLEVLMPKEDLNMGNYSQIMHDCIHLEELSLRQAFKQYRTEDAVFQHVAARQENGKKAANFFTLNFHLHNIDLRPSISSGIYIKFSNFESSW